MVSERFPSSFFIAMMVNVQVLFSFMPSATSHDSCSYKIETMLHAIGGLLHQIRHHAAGCLPLVAVLVPMCPLSRADLAFEVLTADVPGCVLQVAANVPPDPVDDLCAALHLQLLAAGKGVATNLGVVWPHLFPFTWIFFFLCTTLSCSTPGSFNL